MGKYTDHTVSRWQCHLIAICLYLAGRAHETKLEAAATSLRKEGVRKTAEGERKTILGIKNDEADSEHPLGEFEGGTLEKFTKLAVADPDAKNATEAVTVQITELDRQAIEAGASMAERNGKAYKGTSKAVGNRAGMAYGERIASDIGSQIVPLFGANRDAFEDDARKKAVGE